MDDALRRDVRVVTPSAVPDARAILNAAQAEDGGRLSFAVEQPGPTGPAAIDIRIDGLRDLAIPRSLSNDLVYEDMRRTQIVDDPRSSLSALWRVDEATVIAADLAYDVVEHRLPDLREEGYLPPASALKLRDYVVAATYLDTYTGFKAVAFERRDPDAGGRSSYLRDRRHPGLRQYRFSRLGRRPDHGPRAHGLDRCPSPDRRRGRLCR